MRFVDLLAPETIVDGDKGYHQALENSRWLKHIMRILSGASRVAHLLAEERVSVLVHCSDGWDRTTQLVALAQLILDPYYRTCVGFIVLVEKEWCSFGHKFQDRIGVGTESVSDHERSPIFLQFLDAIWQMTRQYPTAFEYNDTFLHCVADALTDGNTGTFLYNTEKERTVNQIAERTSSTWTAILLDLKKDGKNCTFRNKNFQEMRFPVYPRANLKRLVVWESYFLRFDIESSQAYHEYLCTRRKESTGVKNGVVSESDQVEERKSFVYFRS